MVVRVVGNGLTAVQIREKVKRTTIGISPSEASGNALQGASELQDLHPRHLEDGAVHASARGVLSVQGAVPVPYQAGGGQNYRPRDVSQTVARPCRGKGTERLQDHSTRS